MGQMPTTPEAVERDDFTIETALRAADRDWDAQPLDHSEALYVGRGIKRSHADTIRFWMIAARGKAHLVYGAKPLSWSSFVRDAMGSDTSYIRRILKAQGLEPPVASDGAAGRPSADGTAAVNADASGAATAPRGSEHMPLPETAKRAARVVRSLAGLDLSDLADGKLSADAVDDLENQVVGYAATLIGWQIGDGKTFGVSLATLDAAVETVEAVRAALEAVRIDVKAKAIADAAEAARKAAEATAADQPVPADNLVAEAAKAKAAKTTAAKAAA